VSKSAVSVRVSPPVGNERSPLEPLPKPRRYTWHGLDVSRSALLALQAAAVAERDGEDGFASLGAGVRPRSTWWFDCGSPEASAQLEARCTLLQVLPTETPALMQAIQECDGSSEMVGAIGARWHLSGWLLEVVRLNAGGFAPLIAPAMLGAGWRRGLRPRAMRQVPEAHFRLLLRRQVLRLPWGEIEAQAASRWRLWDSREIRRAVGRAAELTGVRLDRFRGCRID
jgi:hypothetical protein